MNIFFPTEILLNDQRGLCHQLTQFHCNVLSRYHMMVTHRSMLQLTGAAWTFAVLMLLISVCLITRLSFCRLVCIVL